MNFRQFDELHLALIVLAPRPLDHKPPLCASKLRWQHPIGPFIVESQPS
jgi:hypothetical protein